VTRTDNTASHSFKTQFTSSKMYLCRITKMCNIHIWRWREDRRVHTVWWLDIFPSYFCRAESGAVYLVVRNPRCFIMTILVRNFCCYFKTNQQLGEWGCEGKIIFNSAAAEPKFFMQCYENVTKICSSWWTSL